MVKRHLVSTRAAASLAATLLEKSRALEKIYDAGLAMMVTLRLGADAWGHGA